MGSKMPTKKKILEKDVEENNRKYAKTLGILFEKYTSPAKRSVPDRLLTFPNGLMVFIEYKAPGKRPSEKQWMDHCKRRNMGVLVYVVDDIQIGRDLMDYLLEIDSIKQAVFNSHLFLEVASQEINYTDIKCVELSKDEEY